MHLKHTLSAGLAIAAILAAAPVSAKPAAKPAKATAKSAKATAKPAKKTPSKSPAVAGIAGKTPTATIANLIAAMKKRDEGSIGTAFDWTRFAGEMNKLIPNEKGLDAGTYKTLLVQTLDVEPAVSQTLRVGTETMKGPNTATVEMKRYYAPKTKDGGPDGKTVTANIMSLYKTNGVWKIYRLDSVNQPAAAPQTPPAPHAPQGMVPAAGTEPMKPPK